MFFFSSKPKRVTKEEWEKIRINLYGKLDERERNELEKFFRADLYEEGRESGITRAEFEAGMAWLRANPRKHEFEENDLEQIEKYFEEHLKD
ncbi:MAG: hypothetical protein H6779_03840 [Candidatus Nomurabacteria bacterium]|nr:MAG: hypothetical protein H6779_03840 [Candidatus Nomurabacteria bacterium]